MIVRELIARLGIDFDAKSADRAEQRMNRLGNIMGQLAGAFAVGSVISFLKETADLASGVEQTMSKLRLNFEDSTQSVLDWAKATAAATGASEYDLREMAATFGSMLVPTFNFDRAKAAEMSQTLSGLAYDLAAINNEDPGETMQRLFSGMTGSSEAVERLGIQIKQLTLEEFARSRGITTSITKMNTAQKADLIYQKMLSDTRDKVGAAAKESDTYAGKVLRLTAAWRDAKTTIGMFVMGPAAKLMVWLKQSADAVKRWAQDAVAMKAAAYTLGAAMLAFAGYMAVANWPILAGVAALGALYLIIDDVITMFEGGESAIGDFLDALGGVGTQEQVVKSLREAWSDLKRAIMDPAFKAWVRDTFDDLIQFGKVTANLIRVAGADIGDLLHFVNESNRIVDDLNSGKITAAQAQAQSSKLWASRRAGYEGVVSDLEREYNRRNAAPPPLPVVGARHGANPALGDLYINISGNLTSEQIEQAKRAAREAYDEILIRSYNTTTGANMSLAR